MFGKGKQFKFPCDYCGKTVIAGKLNGRYCDDCRYAKKIAHKKICIDNKTVWLREPE